MGGRSVDADAGPGRDLRQDRSDGHVDGVRSLLHGFLHAKLAQDTSSPNAGLCWCGLHRQRSVQSMNRWANHCNVTELVAGWMLWSRRHIAPRSKVGGITRGRVVSHVVHTPTRGRVVWWCGWLTCDVVVSVVQLQARGRLRRRWWAGRRQRMAPTVARVTTIGGCTKHVMGVARLQNHTVCCVRHTR